jgi:DNA-binding Xre family transcriptional regulator
MAKAKSYKLQGREWTVKDLAEELGLSTPRVHGLLKEHNEDIKAIFASRGITPKPADKGPKARLFDYKGKQWTVKQLAEEFGLSNVRVNRLIKEHDGDIEKIALSREKNKKADATKKAPKDDNSDYNSDEQSGRQQEVESLTSQFMNMSDELLDEIAADAWKNEEKMEIYLCKGEIDENLGDDYDLNIFVNNSDQIFRDILRYFKNLYENGCDEYPRITMKYKVGNELVTLGLIECILDKEGLDDFDDSIKNCNEIFGFEPVEIEKEDFLIEKSKPIFYYGIDYLEWDIDLENILHRLSGNSKANQSVELEIFYDTPDGFGDAYNKTVGSLGEFIDLCKEIKMIEEQNDKHILIDGEKHKNHLMFKFFKDDIHLGSCGMFKLEENVDDFINGENNFPEYHDQIDFLSSSSSSSIAEDVTAFINIGVTWNSIDN